MPGYAPAGADADQAQAGGLTAVWAFVAALTSIILLVLGLLVWIAAILPLIEQRVGSEPNRQQVNEAYYQLVKEGRLPRSPFAASCAVVGVTCGMVGLCLAVSALIRREPRQGLAITACVLGVIGSFCQCAIMAPSLLAVTGGS